MRDDEEEAVAARARWRTWRDNGKFRVPVWAWPVFVVFGTAVLGAQQSHPWLLAAWLAGVAGVGAGQLSLIAFEPAAYARKAASVIGSTIGLSVLLLLVWHTKGLVILPS